MRSIQQAFDILTSAALPSLSHDELKTLSGAESHAQAIIDQARTVFGGIGCLVNADDSTGVFEDRKDVADLAFVAANLFDLAAGLLSLSNQVECAIDLKAQHVARTGGA